ncbi:MAG TPA: T9SS type A sorting domain-containing protein, partial [Bacteroidia bacterium]|nr:T9SS type A sorting domain-containing protein [Bacteroidia bacterium]
TGTTVGTWIVVPGASFPTNFDIPYSLGSLTILPATLTVEADDKNPVCCETPVFTSTVSGLKYQDSTGVTPASGPTYTLLDNASQTVNPLVQGGTYQIVPSAFAFASDTNYTIQYASGTLIVPEPLVLNVNVIQPHCYGEYGSVDLSATGGTGNYTYGGDAQVNLSAGMYHYTVTDENGCTTSIDVEIVQYPPRLYLTATETQPSCFGQTGSVNLSATGGVPPYMFAGSSTTNLMSGIYTYFVSDSNGCMETATVTIHAAPSTVALGAVVSQPDCSGDLGSVTLTPSGGTSPYTLGGDAVTNLLPGTYNYTVTDAHGCSAATSATIDPAPALLELTATPTNPDCYGQPGSVALSATGGTGSYIYGGSPVSGLSSGTYSYTVIDANGCSAAASATIVEPAELKAITAMTPTGCFGNTGTATVAASGGTPAYTYLWLPGGQTTVSISALAAGAYTVTVTDTKGCTAFSTVEVSIFGPAPAAPSAITGPSGGCRGQNGVVYSVAPVAGASSYVWTLPSGVTGSSTASSITVNFGSTYSGGTICVKAVNGCGSSTFTCKTLTRFTSSPATPGAITGPATICGPLTATYSIAPVANATSYTWTLIAPGATIASGQGTNSITVNFVSGYVIGLLAVQANNCIGNSGPQLKLVLGMLVLPPIFTLSDNPTVGVCAGTTKTYKIFKFPNATSYTWSAPAGAVISNGAGLTGNPLTVDSTFDKVYITFPAGFVSGNVTVYATNACGSSPVSTREVRSTPLAPGPITGKVSSLCRTSGNTYSISAVPGATSYTWTVPAGATITSNSGTSIKVTYGNSFTGSGNITVKANNACGSSSSTSLAVTSRPAQPGSITGPATVCKSQTSVSYSVPSVAGASSYTWSITGGATFVGSTTGTSVKVKFTTATSTSAVLSVKANNQCGASVTTTRTIAVGLTCRTMEEETASFSGSFIAYPNPVSTLLTINFTAEKNEKHILVLTDMLGHVYLQEEVAASEGDNYAELDMSKYASGIYFLTLMKEGSESRTIRIAVE